MEMAKSRAGSRPIRCSRLTTISLIIELLPWRQRSHRGIVAIRPGAGLDTDQPTGPLIDRCGGGDPLCARTPQEQNWAAGVYHSTVSLAHMLPLPPVASSPLNPRYLR